MKNVSFTGHVNKEKIHPAPQGQHCTSFNANGSSLDCSRNIAKPVQFTKCKTYGDKEANILKLEVNSVYIIVLSISRLDMRGKPSPVPSIEVQCRVVKRWPHVSSLLVEVLPWCLLVNNTAVHLIVRDLERDVTVDLPTGSVVAPHRITVREHTSRVD